MPSRQNLRRKFIGGSEWNGEKGGRKGERKKERERRKRETGKEGGTGAGVDRACLLKGPPAPA